MAALIINVKYRTHRHTVALYLHKHFIAPSFHMIRVSVFAWVCVNACVYEYVCHPIAHTNGTFSVTGNSEAKVKLFRVAQSLHIRHGPKK